MEKEKKRVRKEFRVLRDSLSPLDRARKSALIGKKLFSLKEFKEAKTVMFFASIGSEVETMPMIRNAIAGGKRIVLPLVCGRELSGIAVTDPEKELRKGSCGIPEPFNKQNKVKPGSIGLVVVPGLAFDRSGYRIGYGGGYYDRFLGKSGKRQAVGIAFDLQVVRELPRCRHDVPVGKIVTEKKEYRIL